MVYWIFFIYISIHDVFMVYPNKNNGHNLFGVVKLELYGLSFSKVLSQLSPHIVHPFFVGSSETKKIFPSLVEQNAK